MQFVRLARICFHFTLAQPTTTTTTEGRAERYWVEAKKYCDIFAYIYTVFFSSSLLFVLSICVVVVCRSSTAKFIYQQKKQWPDACCCQHTAQCLSVCMCVCLKQIVECVNSVFFVIADTGQHMGLIFCAICEWCPNASVLPGINTPSHWPWAL